MHLYIQPSHKRWISQLLCLLQRYRSQLQAPLVILEHPADRRRQETGIKRSRHHLRHAVSNDVDQAASAEVHHGGAIGVGFEVGFGHVALAGWDRAHLSGT